MVVVGEELGKGGLGADEIGRTVEKGGGGDVGLAMGVAEKGEGLGDGVEDV